MLRWRGRAGGETLLPFSEAAAGQHALSTSCIGMPAVNSSVRMAGGQCPLKGGAIDHHRCHRELVNQLTSELTN